MKFNVQNTIDRVLVTSLFAIVGACGETPTVVDRVTAGLAFELSGTPVAPDRVSIVLNGNTIQDEVITRRGRKFEWDWGATAVELVVTSERAGTVSFTLAPDEYAMVYICESEISLLMRPPGTLRELIPSAEEVCAN